MGIRYVKLTIFAVKQEDLLDASLATYFEKRKLPTQKQICYTDVCNYLHCYIFIYEMQNSYAL